MAYGAVAGPEAAVPGNRPDIRPLPDRFFARSAEAVARDLVGSIVVSEAGGSRVEGRILETEAYLGWDDPASHAYRGRRYAGNVAIYSPPGHWYVYRSHGLHWCANLVTGPAGAGAAVLLRGVRITEGLEVAIGRRGRSDLRTLSNGPGKLCQALGIDRSLDGQLMRRSPVVIGPGGLVSDLRVTPRIGISKAVEWPLRFVID